MSILRTYKYGDNQGHFIIFMMKKMKSKISHLWSNLWCWVTLTFIKSTSRQFKSCDFDRVGDFVYF